MTSISNGPGTEEAPRYTSVRDYLQVVRRHALMILAVTLVFGAAVFIRDEGAAPGYQSQATIQFYDQTLNPGLFGAIVPQDVSPDQRAAIHAQDIYTLAVARRAAGLLHLPISAAPGILGQVSTQAQAVTDLVLVSAGSRSPLAAARLANAYATAAVAQTRADLRAQYTTEARGVQRQIAALGHAPGSAYLRLQLQDELQQLRQGAGVISPASVVQRAGVPAQPSSPHTTRDTLLGLMTGLVAGLLLAFARAAMDSRYSSPDAIERDLGLPILGLIADGGLGRSPGGEGRVLRDEDTEALRILRSKLTLIDVDHPPKTILVTSAATEEGKSTVAGGLAAAFARAGKHTLLLEGDLRVPTVARRLGLSTSPGLSDCLVAPVDPRQSFVLPSGANGRNRNGSLEHARPIELAELDTRSATPAGQASFDCIVAGSPSPRPAELLGSQQFKKLLGQLQDVYEVIVIDSAPLLPVADTLELVRQADCVALCLRVSKTSRKQARAARSVLEELRARPVGLVLTDVAARHGYEPYVASPYGRGWLGPVRGRLQARTRLGASSS